MPNRRTQLIITSLEKFVIVTLIFLIFDNGRVSNYPFADIYEISFPIAESNLILFFLSNLFSWTILTLIRPYSSQEDRVKRDEQIRDTIMAKLVETGEKDKLKELLRDRLISCGWRDELKEFCKDVIRRKGLEKVTVEELVSEITPKGRSTIPEDVKAELLQRIRKFLQAA